MRISKGPRPTSTVTVSFSILAGAEELAKQLCWFK
jgi:hypothetical protein